VDTGNVVSIGEHGRYRPDFAGLASSQVGTARSKLRMSPDEFAVLLSGLVGWEVRPGVVERWESSATPPGDIVLAAATLAQEVPGDVLALPLNEGAGRKAAMVSAIGPAMDSMGDASVVSYADRSLVTRDQWNGIIRGTSNCLWLYGMAEYGYAADPETRGIIRDAVAAGCSVRVLLLDPEYRATRDIEVDEGNPAGALAARIGVALDLFAKMRDDVPEMQIRLYERHPSVSVVRGDSRMMVTPYLRFFTGSSSPTFELTSEKGAAMFGRYAAHFEDAWNGAREYG
jgi:Domain of unknown function (DUF5919)